MTKRIVALVDDLLFQQPIASAAQHLGYAVEFAEPTDDVVAYLVARQPQLIIVDLNVRSVDWERWVMAAKTSPATRKMPILAFGAHMDAARIAQARKAGCDAVISNGAFMADPAGAIQKHARPDESEALRRQAQDPLPELAHKAIEQFNAGEFWEQHETFEAVWRAEPGPVRQMYQGILQVGVAYYQIQRRNYDGARKLFQRAWQYLSALPDVCQGVDIAQLRADAQAAMAELERLGPERIAEFDPALFKPIRLVAPAGPTA
ncbi:MAG: DUF309 domain-containing protein [Thermoflexales bacterium]|nr:DUF309 domain-containing protein [Thermoflexales bacterium]MDW8352639.1 DUF309 domain-containing protein [Anaerolineae bacterium]